MTELFQIHAEVFDSVDIPDQLAKRSWDLAVVGKPMVDIRSSAACEFASAHGKKKFCIQYSPNRITIDDVEARHGAIRTKLRGTKSLLIESTALTCPEILYVLRAAVEEGVSNVSFLYLEPQEYRRRIKGRLTDHRDFDLSYNRRFRSVHGFMANLTEVPEGQAVFFLGFEKARLGQALEQEETLRQWQKHAVFGVPAFEPTWEIDSIANNVQHLAGSNFQIQYAAASSVQAAYSLLNRLMREDKTDSPIVVAPLGTKPHTIGTALFLIEHSAFDRAILLYDHPLKAKERSYDIKRWHIYDVSVSGRGN